MKKNVLGFALLAMSFVAFNGFAQSTTNATTTTCNTTCTSSACNAKNQCKKSKCDRQAALFAGIDLTEAQKTQLQQLDATRKADFEKAKAARKAQREAQKKDGNQQKLTKEQMQAKRQECKAKREAGFRKYLQDVKSILGTEKYTQFLENMTVEKQVLRGDAKHMFHKDAKKGPKCGKDSKGGKDFNGKKGTRGDKGPKGGNR